MSRLQRVNQLIKEEISHLLQRELKDPRLGFVTVTEVDVAKDLRTAKVYVSVLGPEPSGRARSRRSRAPAASSGTGSAAAPPAGRPRTSRSIRTARWSTRPTSRRSWRGSRAEERPAVTEPGPEKPA